MQREPKKRDYGTSDSARLRSLASRGVVLPEPAAKPAERHPEPSRSRPRRGGHAPA